MIKNIFSLLRKFYLKVFIFFENKLILFQRRWRLRKDIKTLKQFGKVKMKNNEYLKGVTSEFEIELPTKEEKSKKPSSNQKINLKIFQ